MTAVTAALAAFLLGLPATVGLTVHIVPHTHECVRPPPLSPQLRVLLPHSSALPTLSLALR